MIEPIKTWKRFDKRMKMREETREQKNFTLIFNTVPVGMLLVDREAVIRKVNKPILKMVGKEAREVMGKPLGEGLGCVNFKGTGGSHGTGKECEDCGLCKVVHRICDSSEVIRNMETLCAIGVGCTKKDLSLRIQGIPLAFKGRRYAMLIIQDVAQEIAAREGLMRYQLLSNNANDIIILATIDGKIIEANRAALWSYGYTQQEIIGRSVFRLVKPARNLPVKTKPLGADSEGIYYEGTATRKDGSTFLVETSMQGIQTSNGKVLLSIQRDITERRQMEDELKTAMEFAKAANMAKSEFLANMSHEIRTPLNGMLGMIDLTLLTGLTAEQRDNLITAKDCASALLNIINDILDFSKIEARKLVLDNMDFDLRKLMGQTVKPHRIKAEQKGLALNYQIAQNVPDTVYGDPNRLKQVINNLAGNAVKFTHNGAINISVKLIRYADTLAELEFEVTDTGVGIASADIGRIFDTFSQADSSTTRKYGGSGLGLAISKQLVELMGGTIKAESALGEGSTFSFTLGFETAKAAGKKQDGIAKIEKVADPLRILLVEDDKINQIVMARMLKEAGHSIAVADNGVHALKIMRDKEFDLVLMDIQMPEMDGIETTKRLRRDEKITGKRITIIALTAYALQGDRERLIMAGMDDYIPKPVQFRDLLEKIEKTIQKQKSDTSVRGIEIVNNGPGENKVYDYKELEIRNRGIMAKIFNSISANTKLLGEALRKGDLENGEKYAHQIRQLSSMASEGELKRAAFRVELAIRKQDLTKAEECFKKVIEEVNSIKKTMEEQKSDT